MMKRWIVLAFVTAWAGCSSEAPPGVEVLAVVEDPGCPTDVTCFGKPDCPAAITCFRDKQSRTLQGTRSPDFERTMFHGATAFWSEVEGPPIESVMADDAGLVVLSGSKPLPPEDLAGLAFLTSTDTGLATLRISGVAAPDLRGRSRYHVEQLDDRADWEPLCHDGDAAYALPAVFLVGGEAEEQATLAFACGRGAVAKAIRWGYAPWNDHGAHFLAALQLARADYCGDGDSHTVDGTTVLVQDVDGLGSDRIADDSSPPGDDSDAPFFFEAGWRGADFNADPWRVAPALCLSKLRWQSVPPGGPCGGLVPDPRTEEAGDFCEDLGGRDIQAPEFLVDLNQAGAMVFSASQRNDAGLWVWATQDGEQYMTTTRGLWGGVSGETEPPAPGYDVAFGDQSYVAGVFTFERGPATLPLLQYRDESTGAYRTTTRVLATPWGSPEIIGFVYKGPESVPEPFERVELRTVTREHSKGTDYLLVSSLNPVPAGYTSFAQGDVEGYGFRLP